MSKPCKYMLGNGDDKRDKLYFVRIVKISDGILHCVIDSLKHNYN